MIQVLALTNDDPEAFAESASSFRKNLVSTERLEWVVYGRVPNAEFREWALKNFPWISEIKQTRYQLREAWSSINPNADYVFQFSDAFNLDYEFDLDAAVSVIDDRPYLAQLSLVSTGDPKDAFTDSAGREWEQHDRGWSLTPCLYRTAIAEMGWPIGRSPEARFTTKLQRNSKAWRFASLKSDPPLC